MLDPRDQAEIDRAVKRTVGLSVLGRLKRMADADSALERSKARWAVRLSILFAAAALLTVAWMVFR